MIEADRPDGTRLGDSDHYAVISADTHAAPRESVYRTYIDPAWRADFDIWDYGEPRDGTDDELCQPLDPEEARNRAQDAGGVVGEVVFPDGIPPFFPDTVLMAGPPRSGREYEERLAGVRALNRWMADFCGAFPHRRAGVGSILLNDLDDTLAEITWIAEHGLRGGVQLPNITPDVDWIPQLVDPAYDRLWAACQDLGLVVNMHLETSLPKLSADPNDLLMFVTDAPHYVTRPLVLMVLSGVFERFPRLKVALTEQPVNLLAGIMDYLDPVYFLLRETGAYGNFQFGPDLVLPRPPSEYLRSNVWYTASPPLCSDLSVILRTFGPDHLMVANDYPHSEGTSPFTVEIFRQMFHDWSPPDVARVLSETPAALYGFDLQALQREADVHGPTVAEIATPLTELPERPNYILRANSRVLEAVSTAGDRPAAVVSIRNAAGEDRLA